MLFRSPTRHLFLLTVSYSQLHKHSRITLEISENAPDTPENTKALRCSRCCTPDGQMVLEPLHMNPGSKSCRRPASFVLATRYNDRRFVITSISFESPQSQLRLMRRSFRQSRAAPAVVYGSRKSLFDVRNSRLRLRKWIISAFGTTNCTRNESPASQLES